MADLLAAALEYATAGVAVFPARVEVVDGHKRIQPVASWRQASTLAEETIRGWFAPGRPWAEASLCIDCGKSGLVVIDLDEGDGKDGPATWAALMAEHDLPATPARARTPSGGEHWYYREHRHRVVGIDSSGKIGHGVDVRGLGGFVIAWPSQDSRGAYGQLDLAALTAAPVVPDLVIERLNEHLNNGHRLVAPTEPMVSTPASGPPITTQPDGEDFWSQWTRREFTREQARAFCEPPLATFRALRTPEDSGFNAKLNAVACIWSHFVPAFMTAAQAEAEIYAAAVANRSVQWQGEAAVRATIASGLGQRSDLWKAVRIDVAPPQTQDSELDREVARLHLRADARDRFTSERHARSWTAPHEHGSLTQEMALPDDATPWRLQGLLGVGHNAVLVAGRKVGKTTMVNNLIRSYVDGEPFLGRFPVVPAEAGIAVFNYEVDERQYRRWMREVGVVNSDRVFVLHLRGRSLPLRDAQVRAWVVRWLRDRRIGLWLLDPYSRAYVGSLDNGNDEAQVSTFLDVLDVVKYEAGVGELVLPAHTPKGLVESGQESAIGSQRLEAWPDSMWYLTRDFDSGVRFLRAEGRDVDVAEEQLTYDESTRRLTLGGWDRTQFVRIADAEAVLEFVRGQPGCSQNDIQNGLGWGVTRTRKAVQHTGPAIHREIGKGRMVCHYVVG
jgi:hypothetical protein